jgi:hypothetical protein
VLTPVLVYAAGVAIGLWRTDGSAAARLALALLWPLGVAAGAITITALVLAAMVLFPAVGAAILLAAGVAWWLL